MVHAERMARLAINGLGRIGRATLKLILDKPGWEVAGINDVVSADNLAYLLKYDTVYGRYDKRVDAKAGELTIDGKPFPVLSEKDPARLPWRDLCIDLVFECVGAFTRRSDLEKHLTAGARSVILSAPAKDEDVPVVVFGVNHPEPSARVLSCASCTTR